MGLAAASLSGCAALTLPVTGIPAHRLPSEILGEPKEGTRPIDLSLLRQPPPGQHRMGPRDVLGVWIDGILGDRTQSPPVQVLPQDPRQPPALGFPITVQEDGCIGLPLVKPVRVEGLTLAETQSAIIRAYTEGAQMLQPDRSRVIVTLIRPRTYRVLVIREDEGETLTVSATTTSVSAPAKRGSGHELEMPAYQNDVLTALALTGGLPGTGAVDRVVIQRPARLTLAGAKPDEAAMSAPHTIVIPLRVRPGQPLPFGPQDVILDNGDVVYIENRAAEVFYTGGLLPAGEYPLPKDYDLDVVAAISSVKGSLANGGSQTTSVVSSTFIESGWGGPSPSLVIILRRTPGGGQVPIRVDLNRALQDPHERILIQPRDVVLLQQTPSEAVARYTARAFTFLGTWQIWSHRDSTGLATIAGP